MWVIHAVVYVVGVVLLCLAGVVCLATGLYTVAEYLEDHIKTTFRWAKHGTQLCAILQLLWLVLDPSMMWPNTIGLLSHATSWAILKFHYPHHMGFEQPATYAALVLLVLHQTAWIYYWLHLGPGPMWQITAVLAAVVWPVPTLLILSAGGESDLPVTMGPGGHGDGRLSGSQPGTPSSSTSQHQPGSPFMDTARRRSKHPLHQSYHSADTVLPADVTGRISGSDVLHSMHLRRASASSSNGGDGSGSGNFSSWLALEQRQQQQPSGKQRRSRVVRALDALHALVGRHAPALLPVSQVPSRGPSSAGAEKLRKV